MAIQKGEKPVETLEQQHTGLTTFCVPESVNLEAVQALISFTIATGRLEVTYPCGRTQINPIRALTHQ